MKKIIVFLFSLAWITVQAQSFHVISTERLYVDGVYTGLKFDNSGNKLLLSSGNSELYLYDLNNKSIKNICEKGADVTSAVFSEDDSAVFFTKRRQINRLLYKDLYVFNLKENNGRILEKKVRALTTPILSNNQLLYTDNKKMKRLPINSVQRLSSDMIEQYVCIENQHLVLYTNGKRQVLDPCGSESSYIWPSIAPDKTNILFTEARKGTFVYNIYTKQLTSIGKVHAPVWVDNNWITGMETKDNGDCFTYGAVFVVDTKGMNKQYISSLKEISMYPSVAVKGNKIAYTTDDGKVYIVKYTIK